MAAQRWALIGQAGHAGGPAADQCKINFDVLHGLASAFGDPDAAYPIFVQGGVPVGIRSRQGETPMPRAAAIYEEKRKWALPELGEDD